MICALHPEHWMPLLPLIPVGLAVLRGVAVRTARRSTAPSTPAESARPHVTGNAPAGDRP